MYSLAEKLPENDHFSRRKILLAEKPQEKMSVSADVNYNNFY